MNADSMMKVQFNSNSNEKVNYLDGYIHASGWYKPVTAGYVYQAQHGFDSTKCHEYRVAVCGDERFIDSGAFCVSDVQCRIVFYNAGTPDQHLSLVVDATSHWANSQSWKVNVTPAVKKRGQIFVLQGTGWVDVMDMPETVIIQTAFEVQKANKSARWAELYGKLIQLGLTGKEARKQMQNSWADVEEFIRFTGRLQDEKPAKRKLERAIEAFAKAHVENVLHIECYRLAGATNAIERYLTQLKL